MEKQKGFVWLVGAGPGDPGLITVRGRELLRQAEVLVYDRLASAEFLKEAPKKCEKINVGKEPGRHGKTQEEINEILVKKALEGKMVVRLKGGDPFVFGRGGEEILALSEHGIAYEVVSGVTSAVAAPAHAGIPVTHRAVSRSFHVITGHTAAGGEFLPEGFKEYAKLSGTLLFLMGLSNLEKIAAALMENGKDPDTPVAVVTDGTLPGERCVRAPLKDLPSAVRAAGLKSPGVIVVGETAAFSMRYGGEMPLAGVSIGITGTDAIFEKLSLRLSAVGAKVSRAAVSRVEKENGEALEAALKETRKYHWIVFTSRNAIALFFEAVKACRVDFRALGHLKFAVVGKGTGEFLESFGFYADYMPEEYTTRALAEGLAKQVMDGEAVLIPRAKQGSQVLTEILSGRGISYLDLPIYDIRTESPDPKTLSGLQYLTFESGSGVRGFFAENPEEKRKLFETVRPVCIGKVTEQVLKEYGVGHAVTAETYTAEGIVEALLREREHGRRSV